MWLSDSMPPRLAPDRKPIEDEPADPIGMPVRKA
jgi:hypothetical protein